MPTYNCITDTTLLSVLRIGASTFSVENPNEVLHLDCGKLVSGVDVKYNKIVGGICEEMTQPEKDAVDADELANEMDYKITLVPFLYPLDETEIVSTSITLSLDSYVSECSGVISVTLPDAEQALHAKKIISQGGANISVTASVKSPYTGFTLGANNRAELVWSKMGGFWRLIEHKGLTFTP